MTTARAPGRLDVMGGIADYSGSLVLQLPIRAEAEVTTQWTPEAPPRFVVLTTNPTAAEGPAEVGLEMAELLESYDAVRVRLARDPATHWAAYVAGAVTVLHHELGVRFKGGIRMRLASDVPAGKGVGSSAAIEVAGMRALSALLGLSIASRDLALLCQKVENLVVGAPCGVMDQMAAACGVPRALMALRCQPAELEPPVALPPNVEFVGLDSGLRHAVTGADYGSVRVGAFMGLRIITKLAGSDVSHGYLANVSPADWESRFRDHVPETMNGAAFLDRYGATTDPVTAVDPVREYAVRVATAHPIHEHARVRQFRTLLQSVPSGSALPDATLEKLGELMYQSHASYGACGLGSEGADMLVDMVRKAGPASGLCGAKITGGGSGGTVAVLARPESRSAVEEIARAYQGTTGRAAALID